MSGFRNALCRYVINTHLTLIQCPGTSLVPQNLNRVHTHHCLRSNACVIAWSPTTSAVSSVPPPRPKILPHYVLLPASASAPYALPREEALVQFSVRVVWPWVHALCSANSHTFVRQHQDWRRRPLGQRPAWGAVDMCMCAARTGTEGIGPAVFRRRFSNLPGRP